MADPALGTKQICPNDQTKFYDLGRRPATCPKCGHQFDPEEALKARVRTRTRAPVPDYEDAEEAKKPDAEVEDADELEEADQTPEIDQAAEADPIESDDEDGGDAAPVSDGDDLGVGFEEEEETLADDDDEAVPFLEDEEDDFPDEEIEGLPEEGREEDR